MTTQTKISTAFMWEAVVTCNQKYDGKFFYAVKTTGIFCRPSCKSKTPNHKNICFFETAKEAMNHGFRPCKRCKPDLHVDIFDPHLEIVEQTQNYLEHHYQEKITLNTLAFKIGVSPYYLNRIFKEKTGFTPHHYLEKVRIEKAGHLLLSTAYSSTEICFQVGYNNFSSFYRQFKKIYGCSPNQYRMKKEWKDLNCETNKT